jgi:hypothetical protein
MARWRVEVVRTTIEVWEVEAETPDEARENASFADGVLLSAEETKRNVKKPFLLPPIPEER